MGVAIRISGKIGGDMGRTEKFSAGYLKYSGEPAESMVDTAYAKANVKLGMIGIQVRIMKETPKELEVAEKIRRESSTEVPEETKEEEVVIEEEMVEEKEMDDVKGEENGDNKEEANEGNE